jgi:hypothetical protein
MRDTLLNCDDHQGFLAKEGRDIADARPDITHQVCPRLRCWQTRLFLIPSFFCETQCLLTLLDSPLNKAGLLQVYVQTAKGVLIEINPSVRIPRTFKRFSGLMGECEHFSLVKVEGFQAGIRRRSVQPLDFVDRARRRSGLPDESHRPTHCRPAPQFPFYTQSYLTSTCQSPTLDRHTNPNYSRLSGISAIVAITFHPREQWTRQALEMYQGTRHELPAYKVSQT